jgi:hypothetical protein
VSFSSAYSVAGLVLSSETTVSNILVLRALRALRALRPLRLIKRFENLKLVVNALISVVPDVINVAVLVTLFLVMFGLLFVQFFKGQYRTCKGSVFEVDIASDPDREAFLINPTSWNEMSSVQRGWFDQCGSSNSVSYPLYPCCALWPSSPFDSPTSRDVCVCLGASWEPSIFQKFDNIWQAVGSLFQFTTTEQWVAWTAATVDNRGIDYQPVVNSRYSILCSSETRSIRFISSKLIVALC